MKAEIQNCSNARLIWSRILIIVGSIGMLIGALDPLEGSVLILPGSGLIALGAFVGRSERSVIVYRVWVFALICIGLGAMWGLSSVGGFGGPSGRSSWWGVLILPYLIGWSMGIWGPRSPRWLLLLGMFVGVWYVALLVIILHHSAGHRPVMSDLPAIVIGILGGLTIAGCVIRLRQSRRGASISASSPAR